MAKMPPKRKQPSVDSQNKKMKLEKSKRTHKNTSSLRKTHGKIVTTASNSSNVSKVFPQISGLPYFVVTSDYVNDSCYTLEDLALHCGVQVPKSIKNEPLASECIKKICKGSEVYVSSNRMIPQISSLPELVVNSREGADVTVLSKDKTKFLSMFEVHSSPTYQTLDKAIFGAANILRLLRNTHSLANLHRVTVFCLPKRDVKWCITEIGVTWKDFRFHVQMEGYNTIEEGAERIQEVIETQHLELPKELQRSLIVLTTEEQQDLAKRGGSEQASQARQVESSSHVMVTDEIHMYKILYEAHDKDSCQEYEERLDGSRSSLLVKMQVNRIFPLGLKICKYEYFKNGPLQVGQAIQCLQGLVKGIKVALDALHAIDLSHNDVRLPNVCFNDKFEPVLIDLDRACSLYQLHPYFSNPTCVSCMYKIHRSHCTTGVQSDYFQLGWLVAWILSPGEKYHERKWMDVKEHIKYNFVHKLIEEYHYDENAVEQLPCDKSIKDVVSNI